MLLVGILMLAGCAAPQCYPPNKIIDNKCCLDDNDNSVCDAEETVEEETPVETEEPVVEQEPQIQQVVTPEPEPIVEDEPEYGEITEMKLGETRKYLTIDDWEMYRSSTDKGEMTWMIYTVKNIGKTKITPNIELYFDGARLEEYTARVAKEYTLDALEPGEKVTFKQSMGIRFAGIDQEKKITMSIYDRYSAPREDLAVLEKTFVPQDEFESMEIFIHGLPTDY